MDLQKSDVQHILDCLDSFEPHIVEVYLASSLREQLLVLPGEQDVPEIFQAFTGFDIKVFELAEFLVKAGMSFAFVRSDGSFSVYNQHGSPVVTGGVSIFKTGVGKLENIA